MGPVPTSKTVILVVVETPGYAYALLCSVDDASRGTC